MAMRTDNFAELLDTPLRELVFDATLALPKEYEQWCNTFSTTRNFEDDHEVSALGAVPAKAQGGSILFEDAVAGGTKRWTPTPYGLGFVITREMWDDDQHNVIRRMTVALRRSFEHLFEVEAAKILNNATSTSSPYTGFNSEALLSTTHTIFGTGATFANKPSSDVDISYTAVQTAMLNFASLVDRKGLPLIKSPSQAIVSVNDMFNAAEIFKNGPMEFGTQQNNKNFVTAGPYDNSIMNVVMSRYLTDTDAWFILSDKSEHSLNLVTRVPMEFDMDDEFHTMNVLARGYCRIVSGFNDWRGVYGSTGQS